MFYKLIGFTVLMLALACTMLIMRQDRLRISHDIAMLHGQAVTCRTDIWNAQTTLTAQLNPAHLHAKLDEVKLAMEPAMPAMGGRSGGSYASADPLLNPAHPADAAPRNPSKKARTN